MEMCQDKLPEIRLDQIAVNQIRTRRTDKLIGHVTGPIDSAAEEESLYSVSVKGWVIKEN